MNNRFICAAALVTLCLSPLTPESWAGPQLESVRIMAVSGADADFDGYYETFSFEFEIRVVGEATPGHDVAARIYCDTTGQGWYTEAWHVEGSTSETVFAVFDQSDFILSGVNHLDFSAELWDTAFTTIHDTVYLIEGEPIKAASGASPSPDPVSAPPPPTLASPTTTTMMLSVNGNGGPAGTLYCVRVASDPVDSKRDGNYVWPYNGIGQRFDTPVWRPLDAWQDLLITNPELKPNTIYTFAVKAEYDGEESSYGEPASLSTLTDGQTPPPPAPLLASPTPDAMTLTVIGNGGPAETEYCVRCTSTSPPDSAWDGSYLGIESGGAEPSAEPFWAVESEWQAVQIGGLQPGTAYAFTARARYEGIESSDGEQASLSTLTDGQTPPPPAPLLTDPKRSSMVLSVVGDGAPIDTLYCVRVTSEPVDPKRNGNYIWPVGGNGLRFDVPVWREFSVWQDLLVTDPELKLNTAYTFVVRSKLDGVESPDGEPASLSTLGDVPNPCAALWTSAVAILLELDPEGYPADTLFAIKCVATDPIDSLYDQKWLGSCDILSDEPLWRTAQEWEGVFAARLTPLTIYSFAVKAKTTDGNETPFSPYVSARASVAGDVNGDCRVDVIDLLTVRTYFYTSPCSSAARASTDLNGDGKINVVDMLSCRANLGNTCPDE